MNIPEKEAEVLLFWDKADIFRKSIQQRSADREFLFFDGPPFATGMPHYGHLVPGTIKDVIPRYKSMRGYRVPRRWGWDCHGLPVENLIEKEQGFTSKKDIVARGAAIFNEACRESVLRYADAWKEIIRRTGRWVDMDSAYRTMDPSYMESIWWVFKQLHEKDLLYEGKKSMHICPRCETPLSNFEVTLGYKEVKDPALTISFKMLELPDSVRMAADGKPVYLLAWTTTPWTLPGNMFLAVNPVFDYVAVAYDDAVMIMARGRYEEVYQKQRPGTVLGPPIKGQELVGVHYEPLFPYYKEVADAFRVVDADFVTMDEGTGIVHVAPAFGEDDLALGLREAEELICHVDMDGRIRAEVEQFAGQDARASNTAIIDALETRGRVFLRGDIVHSYPHCWRCDTPLLNYATSSWFVKVEKIKERLLALNQEITWVPERIKDGRFGKWLEGARDWAISRNRFWGTPLPVWKSDDGRVLVVGSREELERLTGHTVEDLHKHIVDDVEVVQDGVHFKRVPEVLDCWFESGAMPYAQNAERERTRVPADFIAEGQDQTRGWFYTLHVLAAALFDKPAFRQVVVNGLVLTEEGHKMSKRLKNYPEIHVVVDRYGADALRFYLMNSPVVRAENINFSEKGVDEVYKKVILIAENVMAFYTLYRTQDDGAQSAVRAEAVLDRWIVARLHETARTISQAYERYDVQNGTRPILDFVQDLSTWYVRRSRERFKTEGEERPKAAATLRLTLEYLAKLMAPVMPFLAERMYRCAGGERESVHLEDWPVFDEVCIDTKLLTDMRTVRKVAELGLAARAEAGIRVRQPLAAVCVRGAELSDDLRVLVADELNVVRVEARSEIEEDGERVQTVITKQDAGLSVSLDTAIDEELKIAGMVREMARVINNARKEAGLTVHERAVLYAVVPDGVRAVLESNRVEIAQSTGVREIIFERPGTMEGAAAEIDGRRVWFGVSRQVNNV